MSETPPSTSLEAATPSQYDEPTWLNLDYLEKILNKFTENRLKEIKNFKKVPATLKGENYGSAMHLITAKYVTKTLPETSQNVSFIVKTRLENEIMSQIEEEFNIYQREAQVYTVIMPEALKLMQSIGDATVFAPSAIYVDERIVVLENLKLRGYNIEDVKKGFDVRQCEMVLTKLAKFHAVNMVTYKNNPDMFRHHLPGNVSEHPTPLHNLYTNAISTCIEYCKINPRLRPYVSKLQQFGETIIPKMINVFSRNQADRFHTLNHGDIWVNNLMFLKDETGQPIDVLFVDFQEGFFGSPGIDWNYFIFSSWKKEILENHFYDMVAHYHGVMSNMLLKLNYEHRIPTVEDVRKEIINKGYHGLSTATCLLPILINEHEELADPVNFLCETEEASENRRIVFNNPNYCERLELFLEFFVKNGIL